MLFFKHFRGLAAHLINIPRLALAVAAILFLCLSLYLYYYTHGMQVEFEVHTDTPETLQFYWRDNQQAYSENRSVKVRISPKKTSYSCFLPSSSRIDKIRFDPADKNTDFVFKNLVLRQHGYAPVVLFSKNNIPELNNLHQIFSVEPARDGGIKITTSGKDPRIEFSIPPQHPLNNLLSLFVILLLLCVTAAVGTLILHYFLHPLLIKGRLEDGRITFTFPPGKPDKFAKHALALLKDKCKKYTILSVTQQDEHRVYHILFYFLAPSSLTDLFRDVQILCPEIRCQVFYNRSGEV